MIKEILKANLCFDERLTMSLLLSQFSKVRPGLIDKYCLNESKMAIWNFYWAHYANKLGLYFFRFSIDYYTKNTFFLVIPLLLNHILIVS